MDLDEAAMSPYGIAVHESTHSVLATILGVPWHVVYARERHGALLPDREGARELLDADPESPWPQEVFAMVSLAGPIAEAKYILNSTLDRRVGSWFRNLETYGGKADIPTARMWAQEAGVRYEALADDVIGVLTTDKIWLAIERVADALIERRTLISIDVERLVGIKR